MALKKTLLSITKGNIKSLDDEIESFKIMLCGVIKLGLPHFSDGNGDFYSE